MKRILTLTLFLLCLNVASYAQSKFDGIWRINVEKSKNMQGGPLTSSYNTLTIERNGDNISIVQELDLGFYRVLPIKGPLDGSEIKTTMIGRPATAWAKLEGETLKTWFKRETTNNGKPAYLEMARTFTLSADGKTMTAAQTGRTTAREGGEVLSTNFATEVWERAVPSVLAEEKKILDLYHQIAKGMELTGGDQAIVKKHVLPDAFVVDPGAGVSLAFGPTGGMKPPPGIKFTEEYAYAKINGSQSIVVSGFNMTNAMMPAPMRIRVYFVMQKQGDIWKVVFVSANQDQQQR